MKFTPKENFLHMRTVFEKDNTYDSEVQGIADEMIEAFYSSGWVEVEGHDPAPERVPGARLLEVNNSTVGGL